VAIETDGIIPNSAVMSRGMGRARGVPPYVGGVYLPNTITYDGGGSRRIYVFCTANNGHLVVNYRAGNSRQWADQGRPTSATTVYLPNAITFGSTSLYVFGTANNGHLVVNYWDGSSWNWADQRSL
jgi:hypothetical protein